ncbi:DUF4381 domain-containing protein [Microbulbifer magnicolonia]|uniref:DUF4381 domain-containing protein n=1 Tax=Microbulbifer magnicolonia TaxID=3109744 RepID=UPI002B406B5C|nr:DUF4381 domain-containing protein [Microbulbifer sp. GG15]
MRGLPLQQAQPAPPLSPEAQELLAQLHDIHEPAPVGWWPPAPGWWLLALLLLACLAGIYLWLRARRRQRLHNRYRAEGVRLLQSVDTGNRMAPQQINELLKRVAVTTYGRGACGNLTGRAWLDFLQGSAPCECPDAAQRVLLDHLYRADTLDKAGNEAFRDYAILWVQQHRERQPELLSQATAEAAGV